MGSMALWRLAHRGISALGFEQFELGHDRGSGHGESRMIRTAYYEGSEYVPLVRSAFALWRELEQETRSDLLRMTGGLMIGRRDAPLLAGTLRSIRRHDLPHEVLGHREALQRYPQHRLETEEIMTYEGDAGVLRPEAAIVAAARRAEALGARILPKTRVSSIRVEGDSVAVEAEGVAYRGHRAIVCAGPWLSKFLPELQLPLGVERQVMLWMPIQEAEEFAPNRFPPFLHERDGHCLFGMPSLDGKTVKIMIHHEGRSADPDLLDRGLHPSDAQPVAQLLESCLAGVGTVPIRFQVCMYTNTPDRHFVLGLLSNASPVVLVGACSGHGFKFAPVIGEIAADLALHGETSHGIASFSPSRWTGDYNRGLRSPWKP
jgi:sarcosine oxidase